MPIKPKKELESEVDEYEGKIFSKDNMRQKSDEPQKPKPSGGGGIGLAGYLAIVRGPLLLAISSTVFFVLATVLASSGNMSESLVRLFAVMLIGIGAYSIWLVGTRTVTMYNRSYPQAIAALLLFSVIFSAAWVAITNITWILIGQYGNIPSFRLSDYMDNPGSAVANVMTSSFSILVLGALIVFAGVYVKEKKR